VGWKPKLVKALLNSGEVQIRADFLKASFGEDSCDQLLFQGRKLLVGEDLSHLSFAQVIVPEETRLTGNSF
jgi:hypothetical protein